MDSAIALKYSEKERAESEKEFAPMVKLIQHRLGLISGSDATVLRIAHRLRRDAFHRGQIREDILDPILRLLFATVVGLAQSVYFADLVQTFPPADGDEAFLQRFGLDKNFGCDDDYKKKLGAVLLRGAEFNFDEFRSALRDDLAGRMEATINQVSAFFDEAEQDKALLRRQFVNGLPLEDRLASRDTEAHRRRLDQQFDDWRKTAVPLVTREWLLRFRESISRKLNSREPSQVLATYWGLDKKFSPIEAFVEEYVADIDDAIQMEIDIARGK